MSGTVILNAYWEFLHSVLCENQLLLRKKIEWIAEEEFTRRFPHLTEEHRAAWIEAAEAFLDERIEMYNPLGYGYLLDPSSRRDAAVIQRELDWYESAQEYQGLIARVRELFQTFAQGLEMRRLAEMLAKDKGAFPDQSIIDGYREEPSLKRLPDFAVARAIEDLLEERL